MNGACNINLERVSTTVNPGSLKFHWNLLSVLLSSTKGSLYLSVSLRALLGILILDICCHFTIGRYLFLLF